MPNYQDCHIFQRDKSQTSGADKVPAQQIQPSLPQLSLGAESSTAPTGGRSTSGTARRTPSSALAGQEGNKSVGTHLEGNSWWAKAGGPWWAICGGPNLVGQSRASLVVRLVVQLVVHLQWAKTGGPIGSKSGGPFRAVRGRSSAGRLRSSPGVQAWCPRGGPDLGGDQHARGEE